MSKKGVSHEEKRARVLEIFHEDDDVFTLKMIEKLASKKGVVLQSVKDIVQSLVDDDLVHQEKIGISNYVEKGRSCSLWAFAGEASTKVQNDLKRLQQQDADIQRQLKEVESSLKEEQSRRPDVELTKQLLAGIAAKEQQLAALQAEAATYSDVDPERVGVLKEASVVARDAANRWLDNTHALQDWCKKQFSGRDDDVAKFFAENGLTDKMDHLE